MDDHIQHDPVYQPCRVPEYRGNPLIEALPVWPDDDEEQVATLGMLPRFDKEERHLSRQDRIKILKMRLMHYTLPMKHHMNFKALLDAQVYGGYMPRNPLAPEHQALMHGAGADRRRSLGSLQAAVEDTPPCISFLTGATGIGKSSLVKSVLRTYGKPLIKHSSYDGHPFPEIQIVHLKINIPRSHSFKALCRNIVDRVSMAVGVPEYSSKFDSRSTGDRYVSEMHRVLLQHHVGLIVLDDVQNISEAKSGGKDDLLTSILHLKELLGVPILMVGTYKARKKLLGEKDRSNASFGRRIIDGFFYSMERPLGVEDDDWVDFCKVMWEYQWVQRDSGPLTPEILKALYNRSQGITSLTLSLFAHAQILAILSKKEIVDVHAIEEAYEVRMSHYHAKIEALRGGNYELYEELSYKDEEGESSAAVNALQRARDAARREEED